MRLLVCGLLRQFVGEGPHGSTNSLFRSSSGVVTSYGKSEVGEGMDRLADCTALILARRSATWAMKASLVLVRFWFIPFRRRTSSSKMPINRSFLCLNAG